MQKKIIRIISNVPYREHTEPLFKTLNILPIAKLHVFAVQLCVYKLNHKMLPEIFNSLFIKNEQIHTHNTRSAKHFHLPSIRSNIMFQTFRYKGVKSHNYFFDKIDINLSMKRY